MSRWDWLFHRRRREEELDEAVQSHLRMAEQERIKQGEHTEQACTSAVREFGNVTLVGVHLVKFYPASLPHAQGMPEHEEQKATVAGFVPAAFAWLKERSRTQPTGRTFFVSFGTRVAHARAKASQEEAGS